MELDPTLVATFKQLQPGMKVLVKSRDYSTRTLTVKAAHPASYDPNVMYVYVSSGRTLNPNLQGGLIRLDLNHRGWLSYQPTLSQRVSDVLGLTVA